MRSFTVVGILPASFRYPEGAPRQDVWISVMQDPLFGPLTSQPGVRLLGVIGRLKPGVSLAKAQAEMNTLGARLAKEFPAEDSGLTIRIQPYRQVVVGNLKSALLILLSAVGLLLLIACANIANLLLSQATSRGREVAVRIALGASRARIVRQLLTESALLGLLGGVAGLLLAACAVWSLQPFLPSEVVQISSIHVGGPVLVFALLLSLAAALAFGLAPALLATPSNLQTNLKEGGERTGQRGGQHVRSFLAIAEISLAMVLLVAGGLLIRSFALVTSVNPGFDPNNVTEAEVSLPQFQYSTPQQWTAFSNGIAGAPPCAAWFAGFRSGRSAADGPPRTSHLRVQHCRKSSASSRQIHYRRLRHGESRLFSRDANSAAAGPSFLRAGFAVQSERSDH